MKKEAEASLAIMIEKIHADNRNNERTLQIKTEYQNELGIPFLKEEVVGLTSGDLAKETDEDPNHIRKKYLPYPLINLGLVQKTPSAKDGRINIYSLPYNSQNKEDNKDSEKILVKNPNPYPSIFKKISEYEILDESSVGITFEYRTRTKIIRTRHRLVGFHLHALFFIVTAA